MADFRPVSDDFAVSPQISEVEVGQAAAQGYRLIINNRPDGEAPDQPAGGRIEAAARAVGVNYLFIPIVGRPTPEQAAHVREAAAGAGGKTLAFCRSGTRSIMAWALGQLATGVSRKELVERAARAGYDLSGALPD
ncbi:MAG TPA: TIGR01244 family sulfur transferase [Caulobacteraceae bacterium]|nr:TIGR01244 family sulfur transferase [Caulobacteraceae bacterium]